MLLVDESDSIIFKDPVAFNTLLKRYRCICLTATPDDNNSKGAERQVLKALGLIKYQHGFAAELSNPAVIDETKKIKNDEALLEFIKGRLDTAPVLLYCSTATKEYISEAGCPYMSADGDEVDEAVLRELNKREGDGSAYRLVVATQEDSMRGIDYRSPVVGITLIVAKSFENSREADQGLKRVGRQDDPCQRIRVASVPLIDPVLENAYNVRLLDSCRRISGDTMQKMTPLGAITQPTTKPLHNGGNSTNAGRPQ